MGMEANGPIKDQGTPSPVDLILQQRRDGAQAVPQPSGDGGLFAQLSNNPLFTAVGRALREKSVDDIILIFFLTFRVLDLQV